MWIGFANLSFGIDGVDGEIARPVEIEIGIEGVGVEIIDRRRLFLRDMAVAHGFADHRAILAFRQRIIVSLARS